MLARWRIYLLASVVIGVTLALLTWRTGQPWSTQPLLVPIWIVLTPFFLLPAFARAEKRSTIDSTLGTAQGVVVGMLIIQVVNLALAFGRTLSWGYAAVVLALTAPVQVAALIVMKRQLRLKTPAERG